MAAKDKKSLIRLLVIIAVIIIVDIVGGYFLGKKVIIPMVYKNDEFLENLETQKTEDSSSGRTSAPGQVIELDSINLNPADSSGEIFSCDIVLEIEMGDQKVEAELTSRNSEILDKISTYLAFKTVEELNNPNNWERYKRDMFEIINGILQDGKIISLYIPSKIIQFN
ncbi:flagellar basal body-associated FliL family protein [Candidatus Latescibacterota bacterium]